MVVAPDQFFLYTIPILIFFVNDQQPKSSVIQTNVIIYYIFQALLRSKAFFLHYNIKYYNCQIRAAGIQPCKPYEIRKISKQLAASRISSGARACAPNQTTGAYGHMGTGVRSQGLGTFGIVQVAQKFWFSSEKICADLWLKIFGHRCPNSARPKYGK